MRVAVLGTLLVGGCTSVGAAPMFAAADLPPLQLTVSTDPPANPDGAVPYATLRVTFDDYPDPDWARFGAFVLRSGQGSFDIDLRVDLLNRTVIVHPRSLLAANSQYELLVDGAVSSLSGRKVQTSQSFTIQVGAPATAPPAQPIPVYTWTDAQQILTTCSPFCHSIVGASGRTRPPTRNLDFTADPTNPVYGLIGVESVGLAGSPYPLLRVDPGDSARSELLRKTLGGDHRLASTDDPYPEMRVEGRRMPLKLHDSDPNPAPLDPASIAVLQQWIDQGAKH
jgi:hypothetical protein